VPSPELLTLAALRQAAVDAVVADGGTQTALAVRLGVTPGAVSRALKEVGGSRAALQARIVETLTGHRVEELDVRYQLIRSDSAA
jgi:predicted transcriptional regulator